MSNFKTFLWHLFFFVFAGSMPAKGQEISGMVRNQEEEGLAFASLVLWDETGQKMLHFTTTGESGTYQLMVKAFAGRLVVSSLGYQSDTIEIRAPEEGNILQIDVQLQTATFDLQSVEVSDSRIPYKVEGDTVVYQSEFFSDGTEQVVEDLLKKLPGVSVSDEGTIVYKGKQVDKVLLENDDLFGNKYTIGTRSLRADVVENIEFIDHYIDNPLLKEVEQSDVLAMNITIKEDRKKLFFGDVDLGGGSPGRYEGKLNTFSLYKKHKGIVVGSAENTSGSPLDMYTLMGGDINFNNPYEYSRWAHFHASLPSYYPFSLKKAEIKNGRQFQGAANVVLNPGDQFKFKVYALGFNDQWQLQTSSFFRDLNLGTNYEYDDQSHYYEKNHGTEINLEGIWQISGKSNMKYTFNTGNSRLGGIANTIVRLPDQDTIPQRIENHKQVQAQRLNWVRKLNGRQVIVLDAAYFLDAREQDFSFNYQSDGPSITQAINQKNKHQVKDADLLASLLGKQGALKYALSFKYRLQTDHLQVHLFSNDLLVQEIGLPEQFQNDYRQQFLALIGSFSSQFGQAELFTKVELGYRNSSFYANDEKIQSLGDLYPNIRSGLNLSLNKRWRVLISGSIASRMPEMHQVFSGNMFHSFRTLGTGVNQLKSYFTFFGIMGIKYSNNAKLLEFFSSIQYTNNARAFVDRYFYQRIFTLREKRVIDGGESWNLQANLDKYLPNIFANLGLKANVSHHRSFLFAADETLNEAQLNTMGIELSYTTAFHGPLNWGITAEADWSAYIQNSNSMPLKSTNGRYGLNYFFTWKPIPVAWIKLDTRQIFTNNQGQEAKVIYLGGIKSEYRISSALRCGFTVYNLWNTRRFNLEQLSGESYTYNEWQLNPRMLLFDIGLRF